MAAMIFPVVWRESFYYPYTGTIIHPNTTKFPVSNINMGASLPNVTVRGLRCYEGDSSFAEFEYESSDRNCSDCDVYSSCSSAKLTKQVEAMRTRRDKFQEAEGTQPDQKLQV